MPTDLSAWWSALDVIAKSYILIFLITTLLNTALFSLLAFDEYVWKYIPRPASDWIGGLCVGSFVGSILAELHVHYALTIPLTVIFTFLGNYLFSTILHHLTSSMATPSIDATVLVSIPPNTAHGGQIQVNIDGHLNTFPAITHERITLTVGTRVTATQSQGQYVVSRTTSR